MTSPRVFAVDLVDLVKLVEERRAFRHEHDRLYDALEQAAQIAELAGHDILAASLRRDRRDIAAEIAGDACGRPDDGR